jgi:hypothetical protein
MDKNNNMEYTQNIKFNFESANLVSYWHLNVKQKKCYLCDINLHDTPKHDRNFKANISLTKGKCGCIYHNECISGWFKANDFDTCPKCQIKFISTGMLDNNSNIIKFIKSNNYKNNLKLKK